MGKYRDLYLVSGRALSDELRALSDAPGDLPDQWADVAQELEDEAAGFDDVLDALAEVRAEAPDTLIEGYPEVPDDPAEALRHLCGVVAAHSANVPSVFNRDHDTYAAALKIAEVVVGAMGIERTEVCADPAAVVEKARGTLRQALNAVDMLAERCPNADTPTDAVRALTEAQDDPAPATPADDLAAKVDELEKQLAASRRTARAVVSLNDDLLAAARSAEAAVTMLREMLEHDKD